MFFEKIVVSSLPRLHPYSRMSASALEITRVKLLHHIYIHREIGCLCMYMYICHYTHIYIVYFDCCSPLYLPDVIFWKAGVEWDGNPRLLSPLLSFCVAKEDKEQFWAHTSLFGRICIVPLDIVSSFSSNFLKGI